MPENPSGETTLSGGNNTTPPKVIWAIAFAIAFLPSLFYFISGAIEPAHDSLLYWDLAIKLAETGFYGTDGVPEGYTPPGYPFFASLFIRVFGETPFPLTVANLLLMGAGILATGLLGATLYGRPAGLWAMVLTGWLYEIFSMSPRLLTENLFIPLMVAGVWLLVLPGDRSRWWRFALGGFVLGLATLVRGTIVLIIPFLLCAMVVWPWWRWERKLRTGAWMLLVFVCFAIPVGSYTYRNYRAFGFVFPVSFNSGDNLALGNNPIGTFWYLAPDDPIRDQLGINPVDPVATYHNGKEVFLREFRERPVISTLRSFPRLWYTFTDQWPWFANPKFLESPDGPFDWMVYESIIRWQWTIFLFLVMAGLMLGRHTDGPGRLVLLGVCAYWVLFHAIIQMHPRYKIPIAPFFAIYAGFCCAYVLPRLAQFRRLAMEPLGRKNDERKPE